MITHCRVTHSTQIIRDYSFYRSTMLSHVFQKISWLVSFQFHLLMGELCQTIFLYPIRASSNSVYTLKPCPCYNMGISSKLIPPLRKPIVAIVYVWECVPPKVMLRAAVSCILIIAINTYRVYSFIYVKFPRVPKRNRHLPCHKPHNE